MKEWMQHKLVRISALIVLIIISLIAVIIIIAQVYISSHKSELLQRINSQLSEALKGDVHVQNLEVNAWGYFPNINIVLQQVTITDSLYHKPLLDVKEVSTRIPIMAIVRKKVIVRYVKLSEGTVHIFTDSTGYTNKYLLAIKQPRPKDSTTRRQVMIEEVALQNITAVSENAIKNKRFEIAFKKLDATVRKKDTVYAIDLRENVLIKGLGFNLERGSYFTNKTLEARWKLAYNTNSKTLSFPDTRVKIDNQPFNIKGFFVLGDSTQSQFSIEANTKKVMYQQAASILNQRIQQRLGIINFEKPLNVSVSLQGKLTGGHRPRVNVYCEVADNALITPLARFDQCFFTASFTNAVSDTLPYIDENSQIALNHFSAGWGGAVFEGEKIMLTNLVHPNLFFDVKSSCALSALEGKTGLQTLHFVNGTAQIFLQYNGPVAINTNVTQYLSGKLIVKDGAVQYEPRNLLFSHCNGEIAFSPDDLHTTNMECNVGKNHFTVNLQGKDLRSLTLEKAEQKASLFCELRTPFLNLADFRTLFSKKQRQASSGGRRMKSMSQVAGKFDDLLEKGTFHLKIGADTIELNHFTATSLNGEVVFSSDSWDIQQVSVDHAGGSLQMQGTITQDGSQHVASTRIALNNVDIRRAFYAFDNFGLKGLSSQNLRGRLSTNAKLRLNLDSKGDIVSNTMNGLVYFSVKDGELIKFEPLENIKSFVFRDKDLSHVQFAELKDSLIIKDSEMRIQRMEIQSTVMTLYVEGLYSLRGNTDISIQIPLHSFLSTPQEKPKNKGAHAKMGASIHLRARPDLKGNIKIGLDLFKKYRKEHKNDPL
ncbi:AsmA-like C-terminal region [Filimonas lacunae]|uniref:AsmA-like C-terminal region n=1 Tax=Filimonas lacunae TaxID=477680 RepID=A0A173MQ40_9BACT|nr:AsmA-like C-terminal region-containing protein [Filimonas lacunae]BAV09772.1 outer membrane assembly protein [Filimonas lacunae]SIS78769.1 AsmA-like C-terminal region [Filimonas lacunae]